MLCYKTSLPSITVLTDHTLQHTKHIEVSQIDRGFHKFKTFAGYH